MANVSPSDSPTDTPTPAPASPSGGPDDGALMASVAAGDRDAFALVYAQYAPPIMSFLAHTLGDRSAAEDLCQETFVRAWRAAPRFRRAAPLAPWLFRIARNLSHSELRRRRTSRMGIARLFVRSPASDASPVADSSIAAALRVAIGALSERLRSAFVLVRIGELSYEDAARLLDIPVGTVKSRASAAEVELRRRLASRRPGGSA